MTAVCLAAEWRRQYTSFLRRPAVEGRETSMLRPIAVIVAAILVSRPTIPGAEVQRFARVLQEEARVRDFDPLTGVAIIHFETRWIPNLVSKDGEDYGLGQVRARFMSGCRGDEDPVHNPSDACKAAKAWLLSGDNNIRRMGAIITANRKLCKDKTGTALFPQWLAGYEGLNSPQRDTWCSPNGLTWRVVDYQKKLVAALGPSPAPPTSNGRIASRGRASGRSPRK